MTPEPRRHAAALRQSIGALKARAAQRFEQPLVESGKPAQSKKPAVRSKEKA